MALVPDNIVVEPAEEPDVMTEDFLKIEHGDGSISISLDGRPLKDNPARQKRGWFGNLVEEISDGELSRISEDLLRGIEDDIESRREWVESRARGIQLLGLKLDVPGLQGASDGAPIEGMSKVRHPLLLEAVLRFQANARSELLPTDGPVKVRVDTNNGNLPEDQLANALEDDLNHYLTSVATEYYPDTDRMLLMLGFGGSAFKKVYFCPLRNRPVSESVDADDLIVNNAATDLRNAKRVTHRTFMRPSTVRRLQILGVYRDISLSQAQAPRIDSVQREKSAQQGVDPDARAPEDRDREIYECYCELDIVGFEHEHKGRPSGLEIPYCVTIDVSSRQILSITRNYDEETADLPEARTTFVKYPFVPGMGFYDIGLLHILGNTTNAITAAWRELLDAGMYANFPGFLMADTGARQNTNIFRVPPGGGQLVKTGGMAINQAIMPLPYKEPSPALMTLVDNMAQTGMRIGGTAEAQVGEGRADAPVGTTLAMIDQATKVMNAVHKRMHAAQSEEFQLLARVFKEHPESFWQNRRKMANQWDQETFLRALDNCELVPQADPNTASHSQRMLKVMGLKQLQAGNPGMYDPIAIDTAALQALGWNNPQQFMAPVAAQGKMPPEMQEKLANIQIKKQDADTRTALAQAKIAEMSQEGGTDPVKVLDAQTKARDVALRQAQAVLEAQSRREESQAKIEAAKINMLHDMHSDAADIEKQKLANIGEQIKAMR